MKKCSTCGGTGRVVGEGTCPKCAAYGILFDGTRIEITGQDHKQVEEVFNSSLSSAKRSRRFAILATIGAVIVGGAAILANLSQVLAFLGG